MTYSIFLILIAIVAVVLILVIMVQNPKGGGLSSSFGGQGTQNLGGVQNTTNFLDRATWTLAITLFVLILLSNVAINRPDTDVETGLQKTLEERTPTTEDLPQLPVTTDQPAPAQDQNN